MRISFGLIGYGKIGERHAEHISAHPEGALTAAWDVRPDRLTRLHHDYPAARVCEGLADLLSDPTIDLVSICTPNASHAELAIQALEAGKHVLVEKPMALRTQDCRAMIGAAARNAKSLFVVKQNRFNPPVQAVRKLIDADRLGRIYTVAVNCYWNRNADYYLQSDWKGRLALDGGTLLTQFSHSVDVLYYLLGDMDILHARMDNRKHEGLIEFEDTGVVSFVLRDHQAPGVLHYTTSAY